MGRKLVDKNAWASFYRSDHWFWPIPDEVEKMD